MSELGGSAERLDTEGPLVNAAGLPSLFAIAWLLDALGWWPLFYVFRGTYHELGHAATSWLGGRFAFPLPMLLTIMSDDRSPLILLLVLGGLAAATFFAARAARIALALACGSLLAVAVYLSLIASPDEARLWGIFGGCGGEIVLAALVVLAFYVELPDRLRWDFWRWAFVFGACCVLVHADRQWRHVATDLDLLPRGTAIAGAGDSNGDMDRLLRGGWTPSGIVGAYLTLADAAWIAIAIAYVVRLARAIRRAAG